MKSAPLRAGPGIIPHVLPRLALASVILLTGCFLWGGGEEEPRKRTVLFSGGEEVEVVESPGPCQWEGRAHSVRTRRCDEGTSRECLEDGIWRVTGTC